MLKLKKGKRIFGEKYKSIQVKLLSNMFEKVAIVIRKIPTDKRMGFVFSLIGRE